MLCTLDLTSGRPSTWKPSTWKPSTIRGFGNYRLGEICVELKSRSPSGVRLLDRGLTLSFAPFGRSSRVTHPRPRSIRKSEYFHEISLNSLNFGFRLCPQGPRMTVRRDLEWRRTLLISDLSYWHDDDDDDAELSGAGMVAYHWLVGDLWQASPTGLLFPCHILFLTVTHMSHLSLVESVSTVSLPHIVSHCHICH